MNLRLTIVLWKAILVVLFAGEFNISLKCQKVDRKSNTISSFSDIRTCKHPSLLQDNTYLTGSRIIISLRVIQKIGISPDEVVHGR